MENNFNQSILVWRSLAYVAFTVAGLVFVMVLVVFAKT